jgi:hypothetical protein
MFLFFDKEKKKTRMIKMRDEWGELKEVEVPPDQYELSDEELARQLGVDVNFVITNRRDLWP